MLQLLGMRGSLATNRCSVVRKYLVQCSITLLAAEKRSQAERVSDFPGLHNSDDDKWLHTLIGDGFMDSNLKEKNHLTFYNIREIARQGSIGLSLLMKSTLNTCNTFKCH